MEIRMWDHLKSVLLTDNCIIILNQHHFVKKKITPSLGRGLF